MSCELHHELYSWIGGAVRVVSPSCCCLCSLFSHAFGLSQSDGGYLGSDFQAFFSAVVSGAAGVYVAMLVEDAGIGTDLVVTPGQSVSVVGDLSLPRSEGRSGWTVATQRRERGTCWSCGPTRWWSPSSTPTTLPTPTRTARATAPAVRAPAAPSAFTRCLRAADSRQTPRSSVLLRRPCGRLHLPGHGQRGGGAA
eukprot:COSAG04_NODE_13318_length_611_cov_0.986328_1_plen_195_part_10